MGFALQRFRVGETRRFFGDEQNRVTIKGRSNNSLNRSGGKRLSHQIWSGEG